MLGETTYAYDVSLARTITIMGTVRKRELVDEPVWDEVTWRSCLVIRDIT
jgi:hypothetical protein